MRRLWLVFGVVGVLGGQNLREESTRYQVSWPSGLSMGEGQLSASRDGGNWKLKLTLDAAIPGFKVEDLFESTVDGKLCSSEFVKQFVHGGKKAKETSTFRLGKGERVTAGGGGKSEFVVPACAQDALAYLYWVRSELAQGRAPGPRQVFFGAAYDVKLDLVGMERVTVGEVPTDTEHYRLAIKGAASRLECDVYFARDEARTLALVKIPFVMGSFALEWVR
jgi:hypothetical protein